MVIALALFIVASGVHLYACYCEKDKLRQITKLTLMPLLLIAYVFTADDINPAVVLAVACGAAGDYFLLKPRDSSSFISGMMCFLLGHGFYISQIAPKIYWKESIVFIAVGVIVFGGGCAFLFLKLKDQLKEARVPVLIYSIALSLLGLASFVLLCDAPSLQTGLLFIGSLLFLLSDSILSMSIFLKDIAKDNFFIMITYILAQLFIVSSFAVS